MPSSSRFVGRRRLSLLASLLVALLPVVGPPGTAAAVAAPSPAGYWLVASDGGIFNYGAAGFHGSTGAIALNRPIVGMASTPRGSGYWLVASDGGIFSYGDAAFYGSTGAIALNRPIVGMASTPSGHGYWLVASDGGIFAYGDAVFYGSTGAMTLNRPIVGMASTPSGAGYWLVASDGGIFAYGDATFYGSTGAMTLNRPIAGMTSSPGGAGYWLVASDGGIFAYGDAGFFGAAPERPQRPGEVRNVVSMVATRSGAGYWQVSASGEVLAFGDAAELGSPERVTKPVVGLAGLPGGVGATGGPGPVNEPPPGPVNPPTPPPAPYLAPQFFSSAPNPTWGTGPSIIDDPDKKAGRVKALAEVGDMVFIAGDGFDSMVPPGKNPGPGVPRSYLAAVNRHTGALLEWDAHSDGPVNALAVSPDGQWLFVGGQFSTIGGAPAARLAALRVDSALQDPNFRLPAVSAGIRALVVSGDTLYLGGAFTSVGGVDRDLVAAIDLPTRSVRTDWEGPNAGDGCYEGQTGEDATGCTGFVHDMALAADASLLYVVGDFRNFGGEDHGGFLTIDARDGQEADWQAENDRPVFGVTVWPGDGKSAVISTGGTGGQVQFFEWKASKRSSKPKWLHKVDGDATDVTATRERVYLVGHYDFVLGSKTVCGAPPCKGSVEDGDTPNRHLSAFEAKSGAHDVSFTAQANTPQGPYVALVGRDHLYVGGDFTNIDVRSGGQEFIQPGFVQFPAVEPRG